MDYGYRHHDTEGTTNYHVELGSVAYGYSQSTSILQADYYTYHIHPYTWELIDSPSL